MSLLNTGVTAIATAQLGLATTQHNIANANTAGYSRQAIMQATNVGIMTGAGSVGQGVHVSTILRSYSAVLNGQLNTAQTKSSELNAYYSMASRIDNLLADPNSGLSPVLADFFKGVQDVAANPSLLSARQSMVSAAQALTTRFQTLEGRLAQLYDESNTQIRDTVGIINTYSKQIANLNEQIVALSSGMGQPPNDLLDQRDQLVLEMSKFVRVNTVMDSQGSMNVFAGSGQQLVVGNQVMLLEARPSANQPERFVVGLKGSPVEFPESYLNGGALGGLFSFRSEVLDASANSLGQIATTLAMTINAQQALGQDLLGSVAGDTGFVTDFFTIGQPKYIESTKNSGTGSVTSFTFDSLTQSASGNFFSELTGSDYELRFGAGGSYSVTRLSDGVEVASGVEGATTDISFDGVTLSLSGGHAAGDVYQLQPTREIARNIGINQAISGDVRRIAAAAPVRTVAVSENLGTATLSQGTVVPGYQMALIDIAPALPGMEAGLRLTIEDNGSGGLQINGAFPGAPVNYSGETAFSFGGFSFSLSDGGRVGDEFFIQPNSGGVADGRNIVLIGALQTANTAAGGKATYQVAYAQLVSQVGTQTKMALVNGNAQQVLLEQTQQSRDALAGVNLDEEAANLIKYQQSYQAAARMMDTAAKLFDTILSIGR